MHYCDSDRICILVQYGQSIHVTMTNTCYIYHSRSHPLSLTLETDSEHNSCLRVEVPPKCIQSYHNFKDVIGCFFMYGKHNLKIYWWSTYWLQFYFEDNFWALCCWNLFCYGRVICFDMVPPVPGKPANKNVYLVEKLIFCQSDCLEWVKY